MESDKLKHYTRVHKVTVDEVSHITSSSSTLANWRKANGFTSIPGQCGYCLKKYKLLSCLTKHRKLCKAKSGSSDSSSALEEVINDSGPVLDSLLETQEIVELRDQIQKLIEQNEQLKKTSSKANRLLAKAKTRQEKLESKVKKLKAENKKLLEKLIKVLETLLPK